MMENKEVLKVTNEELRKLKVIEAVIEKKLKRRKAAQLLELSVRQVIRLVKRVRREGAKGIAHRLRGRKSNRRHEESLRQKVLLQCRKKYEGFGPTLAQEKLEERDKLYVNRETLRQWMLEEGLWELQRKGQRHRQWRERRACLGEMTQVDGSHHDWLEGRGPELVLIGYIDDATNNVFARFYDYEGTLPAMDSFYRYGKRYGLPHSIYLDRLNAYRGHGKLSLAEELAGQERKKSQFERALEELGVEVIHAQSPQAKGRIERLFKTFQDRLIKEMRLAGVKTKEEANRFLETYLPKYNRRFCVQAQDRANLHRPAPRDRELIGILSIRHEHVLRNDNTIRHDNKFYQILEDWNGHRPKEVTVQERIDGRLYVVEGQRELKYREVIEPPRRHLEIKKQVPKHHKPPVPGPDHPLKRTSFERYLRRQAMKEAQGAREREKLCV